MGEFVQNVKLQKWVMQKRVIEIDWSSSHHGPHIYTKTNTYTHVSKRTHTQQPTFYKNSETRYLWNSDFICSLSDPFYLCAIIPQIFSLIVPTLSSLSSVPLSLVCWLKTCYSGRLVPVGGRKSSLPFTRHIIYSRPWVGLACLWSCCHSPSNSMSGGRTVGKQVCYQTEDAGFLLNCRNWQIEV